jgi:hypothetical protein
VDTAKPTKRDQDGDASEENALEEIVKVAVYARVNLKPDCTRLTVLTIRR